ncbi:hypothetical protein BDN72DRAFT_905275 [Pluteus cervinus]|uniref:Uncharacterized protein n=1 Tax=Pluteus cervinus TaxID=181527 RepID=A0ACD3A320_9AGAR|nr:hypothetical protein BDN72DRAFT_905275 [Pluteus cervinus]
MKPISPAQLPATASVNTLAAFQQMPSHTQKRGLRHSSRSYVASVGPPSEPTPLATPPPAPRNKYPALVVGSSLSQEPHQPVHRNGDLGFAMITRSRIKKSRIDAFPPAPISYVRTRSTPSHSSSSTRKAIVSNPNLKKRTGRSATSRGRKSGRRPAVKRL